MAFSPDKKTLASSSADWTVRLWDVERALPLGGPLWGHSGIVLSLAFSPDGKYLLSASDDKSVRKWELGLEFWASRLCPVIGRNLSRSEWSQIFGKEDYRKTCKDFPEGK